MSEIKRKSKKQEMKIAKDIGGKVTLASGALYFQNADVRSDEFLIEAKTTGSSYYSLKESIWNKVEKEALKDNFRTPLMHIQLLDGAFEYVVMNINTFYALELDKYSYLGRNSEPTITDKKSIRLTTETLKFEVPCGLDKNEIYLPRHDIKFVNSQKHLVVLNWEDFLIITNN